jgi:GTP-binding protein
VTNDKIRNIAIIAHVDHGKTSLVNEMLKQGGVFRENQKVMDRVMDSGDLERERGITILAKNAALMHDDVKINIVDTPGHADFGGEVERVLKMVDGVLLVVDAYEGAMPQTRFVLEKALALDLKVIIVVNKIDRKEARISEVEDEVLELLIDLHANDEQIDSPFVYASAINGIASEDKEVLGTDLNPLLNKIVSYMPAPQSDLTGKFQMLVSATELNDYVGKLAIGKIAKGVVKLGDSITVLDYLEKQAPTKTKITKLYKFEGLGKIAVEKAEAGDIICIAGSNEVKIGHTVCATGFEEALPFVEISKPSVEMTFSVNDSPFAGREGKYVTSRHLRTRLAKEAIKDLSLEVKDTDRSESFFVKGRGEMHLSILIENMRREGFEFQVSMPRVLYKEIDGVRCEPIDKFIVDIPEDSMGSVMNKMGQRKGELRDMVPHGNRMKLEFSIPSRGLFGFKSEFLTMTKGEGIMSSVHMGYEPYRGDIQRRNTGSLIAFETGQSVIYGLFNAQTRGALFIGAGVPVYMGMVVGVNPKNIDLVVNICKRKTLTNVRASGTDDAQKLIPCTRMSLEENLEFLADDELLEVTPESLRIRKTILNHDLRMKSKKPPKIKNKKK